MRRAAKGAFLGFYTDENADFRLPVLQHRIVKGDAAGCPDITPTPSNVPVELTASELAALAGKPVDGLSEIDLPASAIPRLLIGNSVVKPSDQPAPCRDSVTYFSRDGRLLQQSCLALYPKDPKPIPTFYVQLSHWKLDKGNSCPGDASECPASEKKKSLAFCQPAPDDEGDDACDKISLTARRTDQQPDAKFKVEVFQGPKGMRESTGYLGEIRRGDVMGLRTMPSHSMADERRL